MSNKALLTAALCAMVLPASASAQNRTYSGPVVDRPLVVEGYQTRGPIVRGNMYGYYGTNTARRLNFYQLPRYHWYPDSVGYVNQWPYGEMTTVEVPRFAAEVNDPYYVGYYGTDNDMRLNYYALPQYQGYPVNYYALPQYQGYPVNYYPYDWWYGQVMPIEVARPYALPAEVYEAYYTSYGGTVMPTSGTQKPAPQPSTKQPATTASMKVYVPGTADVWCNGVKIAQTGPSREITPDLAAGQTSCEVRVQWMENGKEVTQTRTTQLRPGGQAVLVFSAD
jgi:uncharacterized protein (TIGR03000 family)